MNKIVATSVQSDLVNAALENAVEKSYFTSSEEAAALCSFLACLLHKRVGTVHLPMTREPPTAQFEAQLETLLAAIGAECGAGLRELCCTNMESVDRTLHLLQGSVVARALFRALPRLTSLLTVEMPELRCDDWTLGQFAEHAPNLRCATSEQNLFIFKYE